MPMFVKILIQFSSRRKKSAGIVILYDHDLTHRRTQVKEFYFDVLRDRHQDTIG